MSRWGLRLNPNLGARAQKPLKKKKKKVDVHLAQELLIKSNSDHAWSFGRTFEVGARAQVTIHVYLSSLFLNPMRGHKVRNSTAVFLRSLRFFFFPRRPHIKRPKRVRIFFSARWRRFGGRLNFDGRLRFDGAERAPRRDSDSAHRARQERETGGRSARANARKGRESARRVGGRARCCC